MTLTPAGGYYTRKRTVKLLRSQGRADEKYASYPSWNTFSTADCDVSADEQVVSRKNGWPHGANVRDVGGNFLRTKHEYSNSHGRLSVQVLGNGNPSRSYVGTLHAGGTAGKFMPSHVWPSNKGKSDSDLLNLGVTAISRTIPTSPVAGVATALGELREGLPKVPLKALREASSLAAKRKAVGGEYLNVEFGWKPLLSDVRKTLEATQQAEKLVSQYVRDSGRQIRRRYNFPVETETTTISEGNAEFYPAMHVSYFEGGVSAGKRTEIVTRTTRSWFSGCYTYYLDPGVTKLGKVKRYEQVANRLYGTRVTPEVLWNLTPWSWLADWQTNLGDSIKNVSAFAADGLVLRWGYLMCETRADRTITMSNVRCE